MMRQQVLKRPPEDTPSGGIARPSSEWNETLHLHLSRGGVVRLARLVRKEMKRTYRKMQQSDFVPAEGKRDVQRLHYEQMDKLYDYLKDQIGPGFLDENPHHQEDHDE